MTPRLIATPGELSELLAELRGEPVLAVDTEAASFHRYVDRIYLIQVSTRDQTALIDPLAVPDLEELGALLAEGRTETVFHDADYDLRLFDLQYGFRATRLFDTQIAAEFLGEPGLGLAALLGRYFGVQVDKKFQRADWSARPLSPEMLAYAAADTAHLVALRDLLEARLEQAGRLSWAQEEFEQLAGVRWTADEDREPGWLRLKGAKALRPRQLAILREVYHWRQEVALESDRAEFRIVGNEALLAIAQTAPENAETLATIRGMGREILGRRGPAILAAIARAQRLHESDLPLVPRPPRPVRDLAMEARLTRLKAARGVLSERYGLAPGVLCPNSLLEAIAKASPTSLAELGATPGVRRWQLAEFGEHLLAAAAP
jgi:ribonuclease D